MEGTREMTADELVTDLELQSSQMEYGYAVSDWKLLSDAATMLRQQQAEIEALKRHRNRLETLAEQMLQGDGNE